MREIPRAQAWAAARLSSAAEREAEGAGSEGERGAAAAGRVRRGARAVGARRPLRAPSSSARARCSGASGGWRRDSRCGCGSTEEGTLRLRTYGGAPVVVDEQPRHSLVHQVLHELGVVDRPVVLRTVAPDAGHKTCGGSGERRRAQRADGARHGSVRGVPPGVVFAPGLGLRGGGGGATAPGAAARSSRCGRGGCSARGRGERMHGRGCPEGDGWRAIRVFRCARARAAAADRIPPPSQVLELCLIDDAH